MVLNDIRYALRQLRRSPGFFAAAVLTLALGLGASSAIFCLIDGLWLHPMNVPHSSRLVRVLETTPQDQSGSFNYSEYQAIAQRSSAFQGVNSGVVALGGRGTLLAKPDGTSTLLLTNIVSSNFFSVLGVQPILGRLFTDADAAEMRTHPGVVLGYRCWQRTFGGDPNIVGRQIPTRHGEKRIDQLTVWGVLPATFREIDPNSDRDLWMPIETWAATRGEGDLTSREFRWFQVIGRLAPGATVAEANDQVTTIAKALAAADPANNKNRGARAISDFAYRMDRAGATGLVLFAIVGCVVLLGTLNLAQLLLARALSRSPEVALRLSLGARRAAVARQLLVENLLLGMIGLAAGLALASIIAALLPRLLVSEPAMLVSFASTPHFALDWRVLFFATALAALTMILLALVPLSLVARPELLPVLQSSSGTRTEARTPLLRRAAIWLQVAISFALLVSTGAMVRSFLNTRTQHIGLTRSQVLMAFTQDPDEPMRHDVLEKLRAMPGVVNAAYGIRCPLMPSEGGIAAKVLFPSHPEMRDPVEIKYNAVSPNFLDVTGTRIVRGRGFAPEDDRNGPPVVLIDQAMAEKYWAGQDPIGQVVRLPGFGTGADNKPAEIQARVVGVTENAPIDSIGEIPEPYMYLPFHLSQMGEVTFVMRTGQNAMSMAQSARDTLIHIHPGLDPMMVSSLPELIRYSAGNYQVMAELVSALGFIGLALTIVGLYGFLAFRVARRRREIGIRMALGASREATAWLVVRETAWLAVVGLGLGVALSVGAARIEASMLFGVRPLDAVSIVAALWILMAAVATAAWAPARRAASVDPIEALRTE